jgi:hypothetical protein
MDDTFLIRMIFALKPACLVFQNITNILKLNADICEDNLDDRISSTTVNKSIDNLRSAKCSSFSSSRQRFPPRIIAVVFWPGSSDTSLSRSSTGCRLTRSQPRARWDDGFFVRSILATPFKPVLNVKCFINQNSAYTKTTG